MLPGILNQLGPDSLTHLKRLATAAVPDMNADAAADDDDEVQSVYLQKCLLRECLSFSKGQKQQYIISNT